MGFGRGESCPSISLKRRKLWGPRDGGFGIWVPHMMGGDLIKGATSWNYFKIRMRIFVRQGRDNSLGQIFKIKDDSLEHI